MGWNIKHSKKGYQIESSISGSFIHEKEYLTEDETKAVMIEDALFDFYQKVIKIDKDFLNGYRVNDKRTIGNFVASTWMSQNWEQIDTEALEILKRLNVKMS